MRSDPSSSSSSSGKARCRPPGCHVKDHALIPTPPADPVDTVTLEPRNTFSRGHGHRVVPPEKHRVAPQVGHSVPAWLALRKTPKNKHFILCYTTTAAFWQPHSNRAARVPPYLVQVTLAEHQILGTSESRDRVVWRGETGCRSKRAGLDLGRRIQVWPQRSPTNEIMLLFHRPPSKFSMVRRTRE